MFSVRRREAETAQKKTKGPSWEESKALFELNENWTDVATFHVPCLSRPLPQSPACNKCWLRACCFVISWKSVPQSGKRLKRRQTGQFLPISVHRLRCL